MKTIRQLCLGLLLSVAVYAGHAQVPDDAVWIDVRSPIEYITGHLPQAIRISHDDIEEGVAELHIARDTPIYLYCGSGGRAGMAKETLEAAGYTNVTNAGGLEDARQLAGDNTP